MEREVGFRGIRQALKLAENSNGSVLVQKKCIQIILFE